MSRDHLICDGDELILGVPEVRSAHSGSWTAQTILGSESRGLRQYNVAATWTQLHIPPSDIRSIHVESLRRRVLGFISVGDEQIVIELKSGERVTIPRHREAKFFDSYVDRLRDFCRRYNITFATEK